MTKITTEQSREIYELATKPNRNMSNAEIGQKYGISERSVRRHIQKWERKLHSIAKTNEKAAEAIAENAIDVHKELKTVIAVVKNSISEAKLVGVSPERLAPLINNWLKGLEQASELLGNINGPPQTQINIQVNLQVTELMNLILNDLDGEQQDVRERIKTRITTRLRQIVGS